VASPQTPAGRRSSAPWERFLKINRLKLFANGSVDVGTTIDTQNKQNFFKALFHPKRGANLPSPHHRKKPAPTSVIRNLSSHNW